MTERPSLLSRLYDMDNADLVESWNNSERAAATAMFERDMHRGEVMRRIKDADMAGLDTDKGGATFEPQYGPYVWDQDALRRKLLFRLLPAQLAECVEAVPALWRVKTVAVKKYAQRLGISEAELAECYTRTELAPKLTYHEPQDLLEQLEASVAAVTK